MNKLKYIVSNEYLDQKLKIIPTKYYLFGILVFGFLIRGRQYFANRSFWLDEAFLANNLKFRSFSQLLEPLEYAQVAPIGFLWSQKLIAYIFGLSELSLRFIPFISSLIAIYLVFDLARVLINKKMGLIVAFAFTLPLMLTYFASELKQYSTDVLCALLLFWVFYRFIYFTQNKNRLIILGIAGAICIWFSNITVLILFSIGIAIWIDLLRNFSLSKLWLVVASNLMWLISFFYYYTNFIQDHPHKEGMMNYWASSFMPHDFLGAINFVFEKLFYVFKDTISLWETTLFAMLFFFIGVVSVFLKKSKSHYRYLLIPILLHLILSYFKMYPFDGRLVLYLVPIFLLFEFIGIYFMSSFFKNKTAALIIISTILLSLSFLRAPRYFVNPMMGEDLKPVLSYVSEHKQAGDVIYVYYGSHAAFRFYKENYFAETDNCIVGEVSSINFEKFTTHFESLQNRVWVIFSHMNPADGVEYFKTEIPKYEQLDYFEAEGAKTYLIYKR